MMLNDLLRDRITVIWLALVLATITCWLLGVGHELPARYASVSLILIAFVKVRFVGRYFMELRDAPMALLAVFEGWVAVVAAALIGLFLCA